MPEKKTKDKPKDKPKDVTERRTVAICNEGGLKPEHIAWLLDSLGKVGGASTVTRLTTRANARGKKKRLSFDAAIRYALEKAEERRERETAIKLSRGMKLSKEELSPVPFSTDDNVYPKRVSPTDIGRSLDAAREKLAQVEKTKTPTTGRIHAEILLRVIERIKTLEAIRVARMIAARQDALYKGGSVEEIEEERRARDEARQAESRQRQQEDEEKAQRTLDGFGKGLHTLIDEATEVVGADYDASAKVLNQWIGAAPTSDDENR